MSLDYMLYKKNHQKITEEELQASLSNDYVINIIKQDELGNIDSFNFKSKAEIDAASTDIYMGSDGRYRSSTTLYEEQEFLDFINTLADVA